MKNLKESLLGDQHINEESFSRAYDEELMYKFINPNCFAEVMDFINYTKVQYLSSDVYDEIDETIEDFKDDLKKWGLDVNYVANLLDKRELLSIILSNSYKRTEFDMFKKEYRLGSALDIIGMFGYIDRLLDANIKNWKNNTTIVVKQPTGADRFLEVCTDNRAAGVMLQEIAEKGDLRVADGIRCPFKSMEYVESKYGRCSLYFNV